MRTPDDDASSAPFGALAPNAAQAVIIALTQRTGLRRGAFRPTMSRLWGRRPPRGANFLLLRRPRATGLRRGAFRPTMSRLVDLLRAGPVDVHYQRSEEHTSELQSPGLISHAVFSLQK